jgi:hypothetical protein
MTVNSWLTLRTEITGGTCGSVVGWGTMLQAGRSPVRVLDEVDFFNLPNTSSRTMTLGSTQPLTEMSTRNLPGGNERPACRADNLVAVCEPNVWKCGSLQGLYRDNFTFTFYWNYSSTRRLLQSQSAYSDRLLKVIIWPSQKPTLFYFPLKIRVIDLPSPQSITLIYCNTQQDAHHEDIPLKTWNMNQILHKKLFTQTAKADSLLWFQKNRERFSIYLYSALLSFFLRFSEPDNFSGDILKGLKFRW